MREIHQETSESHTIVMFHRAFYLLGELIFRHIVPLDISDNKYMQRH